MTSEPIDFNELRGKLVNDSIEITTKRAKAVNIQLTGELAAFKRKLENKNFGCPDNYFSTVQ